MKIKFKQRESTTWTKRTTTSHFSSLNIKNTTTYADGNAGHKLGHAQQILKKQ
jgi:hypothetical protein